jgi:hypothetical protein
MCLFNDVVSNANYIALNGAIINERELEEIWKWPTLRYCPCICLKELRKILENISQNIRSPGRELEEIWKWPTLRYCPCVCLKELRKILENISQNIRSPGRELEEIWKWPALRYCPCICLKELRKILENISQNIRSPGRDLNPRPPEYEASVLATRRRHLVAELMRCS